MFKSVGGWQPLERYTLYQDRFEAIREYVTGKVVLDCGPGGEEVAPDQAWWHELFLHKKIKEVASECVGVDIDKDTIDLLNEMGYNIQYGNVEDLDIIRKFDTVVGGEFIEHLSNPGRFLDSVARHLKPGGKLILTTPNAWALGNLIRALLGRKIIINKGHVAWYDLVMLEQLLNRHGFQIERAFWLQRVFRRGTYLVKFFPFLALNFGVVASLK